MFYRLKLVSLNLIYFKILVNWVSTVHSALQNVVYVRTDSMRLKSLICYLGFLHNYETEWFVTLRKHSQRRIK